MQYHIKTVGSKHKKAQSSGKKKKKPTELHFHEVGNTIVRSGITNRVHKFKVGDRAKFVRKFIDHNTNKRFKMNTVVDVIRLTPKSGNIIVKDIITGNTANALDGAFLKHLPDRPDTRRLRRRLAKLLVCELSGFRLL